jgi:hypothetical protein
MNRMYSCLLIQKYKTSVSKENEGFLYCLSGLYARYIAVRVIGHETPSIHFGKRLD